MKKLLLSILFTFCFSLPVFADSIIYSNGNVVDCKIIHVVSGMIGAKTKGSFFETVRTLPPDKIQDIVTYGIIKTNQIKGEIVYMDQNTLRIKSQNNIQEIKRYKVKNIRIYTN